MRQTRLRFGLLWAMLLTAPVSALAGMVQGPTPKGQEVQRILRDFQAPEWKTRAEAFDRLISLGEGDGSNIAGPVMKVLEKYPNQGDQMKFALMRLLERENTRMEELNLRFEKTGQTIGQDYDTDYYANVVASVATLKDIRSMNALLGAITTGGMAVGTLAEFAPLSLDPVLAKADEPDPLVRMSALNVLERMLEPPNYNKVKDPVYRSKMKQAFIRATSDYNPVVRGDGARGLGTLGDTDVIPLLEKLARDDPAFLPHQADEGKDLYFVRLEAQRALAQIRSKSKKPD